ncbi:MAG: IS5 family transposase [Candidatus Iainarchaeum sp.]|jgi:transposase|uniref:Transposase DDE domain protein n=1 Tax=candidate division CPR1 bacterium ADurb.Bin160 TaxID=1852826 RepID=A0A1V5ZKN5_9BACT|nr:MAG: Transposase DDE domain protein [candidate division CPR1 bacterium ADurb.Bin160]
MEDMRKVRGLAILKEHKIKKIEGGYLVPSQNKNKRYFVAEHDFNCTCPDCQNRHLTCKHAYAVKYYLGIEKSNEEGIKTIEKVPLTYTQAWNTYNQAQQKEVEQFDVLLKDLLENVEEPSYEFGRPTLSKQETLFCAIKKVYSQMSSRRAKGLFNQANEKEFIKKSPHFNAVSKLLNEEETEAILENLILLSAQPLKSVETSFAVDSSGFRTTTFNSYCQDKHGANKKHKYMKAHILVGTKTNIICSAKVTDEYSADCPEFKGLIQQLNNYNIQEVSADKAYSSRDNLSLVNNLGAVPFIPFKSNATGKPRGKSHIWRKMFNYFQYNQEEFLEHYHKRSNVETTFHMIKSKLGDSLKSKNETAQKNELLCKLIAHNIIVLISETSQIKLNSL